MDRSRVIRRIHVGNRNVSKDFFETCRTRKTDCDVRMVAPTERIVEGERI